MMDQLVSTALLGTRGESPRLPPLPEEVSGVLPANEPAAEAKLLDAAAAMTLYLRAGTKPVQGIVPVAPAARDQWQECSPGATAILGQILTEQMQPLLLEWLVSAAHASRRPPHQMLPALLEAAVARRVLRAPVSAVLDERGRWLTQFNAKWQFTGDGDQPPVEQWHVGNRPQRAEALRAVRASHPAQALELIAATWSEDPAEARAEWVECLLDGLSDADEPFLESCLDDRSARVREAAADLLARLPKSLFVERMIARVTPCVTYHPGVEASVLKLTRGKKASWDVTLPEAFEKSMQRDGMSEKPSETLGPKQWWLRQMIGCVPLDHWTSATGASPADLVGAANGEFAAVLIRGWLSALARRPVAAWIEPLVAVAGTDLLSSAGVLQAVPVAQRAAVMATLARNAKQPWMALNHLIEAWRPLDEDVSRQLLESFDLRTILTSETHFYLHPRQFARWEGMISVWEKSAELQRRVDHVLSTLALRRELHKEFVR